MKAYTDIVRKVLEEGKLKENRTGIGCIAVPGAYFEHDMSRGFPLLTTKKVPFRLIASELEFFIKGITDKKWLQDRNNHIWDEWCSPEKIPYRNDPETQKKMMAENDLGPIYGWQWRHFGAVYPSTKTPDGREGIDQLKKLVEKLKTNPNDRRMIVSAWNPLDLERMGLPPCHYAFQVTVIGDTINLMWNQRSVDVALGLPFNIASYALLLHLLARETGFRCGKVIGFLGDTHIYENHVEGMKIQLEREPYDLPEIETTGSSSFFDWEYTDSSVTGYKSHPPIKFEIAV